MNTADTLNAAQAAEILFADTDTVLELARQGMLPGTKIGKCWVFLRDDVLAFLRARIEEDTKARRDQLAEGPKTLAVLVPVKRHSRRHPPPILPSIVPGMVGKPTASG